MRSAISPEALAVLLSDPSRADAIPREQVPELLGQLERLKAELFLRLSMPQVTNESRPGSDTEKASGDRLLTVSEAAGRLGLTEKALYRRAASLPFTRKVGRRTLRFSEKGLEKWLSRK